MAEARGPGHHDLGPAGVDNVVVVLGEEVGEGVGGEATTSGGPVVGGNDDGSGTKALEHLSAPQLAGGLRARDGVVSILGNHDYMSYHDWPSEAARQANLAQLVRRQRDMGWRLLLNDNVVVRRGADSIAIVGVENDGLPPFPQRGDLTRAQRGVEQAGFKVLLSHDPTHWRRSVLSTTDIDLTLSGHTHGMQLKIGGFSPASWFYDEWGGFYYDGGRALHVSLGAGEVLMPFRLGAWPEVNVITLRKK